MGYVRPFYDKYQTGGMQHLLASQIREEVGDDIFKNFYKFTIVRNPWDKIVSQFMYMQKRRDLREFSGMKEDDSLKVYLSLILKKKHVQWEHQYKFFLDDNGEPLVDYIGRFEKFDNDVKQILKKRNLNKTMFGLRNRKIPHYYKSKREHYRYYFDEESSEMVQEMYKKDIELLGYKF
jgi:hypothetical protein